MSEITFNLPNSSILEALATRIQNAVFIANDAGQLIFTNPAAGNLVGFSLVEMQQMVVGDLFARIWPEAQTQLGSDDGLSLLPEEAADTFATIKQAGFLPLKAISHRKDDRVLPIEGTAEYLADNGKGYYLIVMTAVTENKHIATPPHTSDVHFRNVLERVKLIAIMMDTNANLLFCNDYFLELTGWQREEVLGQNWFDMFIPAEINEEIQGFFYGTVLPDDFLPYYENEIITREHVRKLIAWNNTANTDQQGNVISVTSIGQDVTDQKRSTEELTQRAVHMALINKLGHQIAAILDQKELLQQAVQQIHKLFNYHHAAIFLVKDNVLQLRAVAGMYQSIFPFGHVQSLQTGINGWVATHGQMVLANDVTREGKYTSLIPDHSITQAELCLPIILRDLVIGVLDIQSPMLNAFSENDVRAMETLTSQIAVALGNAQLFETAEAEILARRQAEEELRNLSHVVAQSPVSVVITDTRGVIQYVNAKFEEVTGYTAVEAVGQNPRILKSNYHDAAFYETFWQAIINGEEWRGEIRNKRKSGELFWEQVSVSPVIGQDNVITNFVAIKEDITKQKDFEERMRQQDRLAAVGQLAAGIAHDFNNILSVISLYGQILRRDKTLQESTQSKLATIVEQTNRASDLIEQILDFSRKSILKRKSMNFLMQIKDIVKLLQRTLPENIAISLSFDDGNFIVRADPTRLQQMVMNLCVNARDAMPEGGELMIRLEQLLLAEGDPRLLPDMSPGEWLHLVISDTGVGISEEIRLHLYEPFFTTKREGKGTGLGLAQVYGIVMQHEGFIEVESEVGIGTAFHVYLPVLATIVSHSSLNDLPDLPMGKGEQVLVVEDDPVARDALQETLERLNYKVAAVENGRAALDYLVEHKNKIQLIISDVVMPQMGGQELLQNLNKLKIPIPIIMLTGYIFNGSVDELKAEGMFAWITKPPDLEKLAVIINNALTHRT